MLNQPSWFSESYYYEEKFKELTANGDPMTKEEMVAAIEGVGGAWAHYQAYGYKESYTSSGAETYFSLQDSNGKVVLDSEVYCTSKLEQLLAAGDSRVNATSTWQDVAKLITENANMSLYDHFVKYGQFEGLSISDTFSAESFFKAKLKQLQATGTMPPELNGNATWQQLATWYAARNIDSYESWSAYGLVYEGITADDVKPGAGGEDPGPGPDPVDGKTVYLNPMGWSGNIGDGSLGFYPADDAKGTDQGDKFVAYVYDDENSLNTGDSIKGYAGVDTLEADIAGEEYNSALTPIINSVEILKFRVQEQGDRTGDNNVRARIDAERINVEKSINQDGSVIETTTNPRSTPMGKTGAYTEFWSWNSRDDLLIEDVRIDSTNVVVGMQDTDPGLVDYLLYFDPLHLVREGQSVDGTIVLRLLDTQSAAEKYNDPDGYNVGANETGRLTNNPFDRASFFYNDVEYEVVFGKVVNADGSVLRDPVITGPDASYQNLLDAINVALTEIPALKGVVTARFGDSYKRSDTKTGESVYGLEIVLEGEGVFKKIGWGTPDGKLPDSGAIDYEMDLSTLLGCPLIQTNIALDDVGRVQWADATPGCLPDDSIYGSNAGDMVVGSMATRGGIERFDVFVDRGSWLSSLSSTNNTLRMITVAGTDWNGDGVAGFKDVYDYNKDGLAYDLQKDEGQKLNGQLFIGDHATMDVETGVVPTDQTAGPDIMNWQDAARLLWAATDTNPLNDPSVRPGNWGSAGIWDVKLFDATGYTGDVNIAAVFTAEARDKYLADVDGLRTVYKDSNYAPSGDFAYIFDSGNDTLNMLVNGGIAADRDFILNMNMGEGRNYVNFAFDFKTGNQVIDQAGLWTDGWAVLDTEPGSPTIGKAIGNKSSGLKNVSITMGGEDDTVWAWGDGGLMNVGDAASNWNIRDQRDATYDGVFGYLNVNAGAGDDAVYTAQDGGVNNAVWVLNANSLSGSNEDRLLIRYNVVGQAQPINNNVSSTSVFYSVQGATLRGVVEFLGVAAEFEVNATSGQVSADAINKAIIKAVEESPLSKLIAVFDGAGQSLLVQSLIDGRYTVSSSANDADNSYGFNVRFDNIIGDTSDYVQQARTNSATDVGSANRVFEIDFLTGTTGALNAGFAWGEVGKVYTITIDDTVVKYTQQITDRDWLNVVEGLQADLVAKGLGGVYRIETPDRDRDGLADNPNQLSIVRLAKDYVGVLTSTTTLTAAAAPAAATYVVTFGGQAVTFTTTLGGWIEFATLLDSRAPANYTVTGTAAGVTIRGVDVGETITTNVVGAVINTEVTTTGYNAVDPNINYSVADFTVPATGTLTFTLDTGWTVTEGMRYTVHLDNDGPGGNLPVAISTADAIKGTTWTSLVQALDANAGGNYTITSTSVGVLQITSKIDANNLGNTTHTVSATYDVTCSTESFMENFGFFGALDAVSTPGTAANATTITWTGVTAPANGTYTFNFGGETITLAYNGDAGGTPNNWAKFQAQLQTEIDKAVLNYINDTDPDGAKLTVYNGAAIAGLDDLDNDGASDRPFFPAPDPADPNQPAVNTAGYYIVGATGNGITITGYGVPNIAISTSSRAATTALPNVVAPTGVDFSYIAGVSALQIDGWEFDPDGYNTYEITLSDTGLGGGSAPVTLTYTQRSGDKDWADIAEGLNEYLKWKADLSNADTTHLVTGEYLTPANRYAASLIDGAYSIQVGSEEGTLLLVQDGAQSNVTGILFGATAAKLTSPPRMPGTLRTPDITYDPNEDTRILTITPDNFTNLTTAGDREISIDAWDFTAMARNVLGDEFAVTIDPDGSDGPMAAFTLTYRQGESGNNEPTWNSIVTQLQSQIKNTPAGQAFDDKFDLIGYNMTNPTTGDEIYGLRITSKPNPAGTGVGLISNYGADPTITITYTDANGDIIARDAANELRFERYEDTDINSTPAVGTDDHFYGLSEVYGGDGDDVIATGFADAIVHAGAGNDVIVVGNETYNFIYGEGGENTIYLGVFSRVDNPNTTGDVNYNRTGFNYGNNGNNVGTDVSNPDAHDKVVVNGGKNVIYNFDVDTTANTQQLRGMNIQSDRLYGVSGNFDMGIYDAATGVFTKVAGGPDMELDNETVILIGVGNVPGTIGLGGGNDEFGDYITVTVA